MIVTEFGGGMGDPTILQSGAEPKKTKPSKKAVLGARTN